jgi:hypothetical protein
LGEILSEPIGSRGKLGEKEYVIVTFRRIIFKGRRNGRIDRTLAQTDSDGRVRGNRRGTVR